jgi:KTSC domain
MKYIQVDSSMFDLMGYDVKEKMLEIRFISSGSTYQYFDVPASVWKELKAASSKGSYLRDCVIDCYPYAQLGNRRRR